MSLYGLCVRRSHSMTSTLVWDLYEPMEITGRISHSHSMARLGLIVDCMVCMLVVVSEWLMCQSGTSMNQWRYRTYEPFSENDWSVSLRSELSMGRLELTACCVVYLEVVHSEWPPSHYRTFTYVSLNPLWTNGESGADQSISLNDLYVGLNPLWTNGESKTNSLLYGLLGGRSLWTTSKPLSDLHIRQSQSSMNQWRE